MVSPRKRRLKSIIVSTPKEYAEMSLDGTPSRRQKRKKKKVVDRHGKKARKIKTGRIDSSPKQ